MATSTHRALISLTLGLCLALSMAAAGAISTTPNTTIPLRPLAPNNVAPAGAIASTAGDINGDGFSDLVVVTPEENGDSGIVRVFLASNTGSGIPSTPSWTAQHSFSNPALGQSFGTSLAVGDVNGDGFADLVVGAPQCISPGNGCVFVYFGSATFASRAPGTPENADWSAHVSGSGLIQDDFGISVAVGDLNGDRLDDIVVGAPGRETTGVVFVWLGNTPSQWIGRPPGDAINVWTAHGTGTNAGTSASRFGQSVAASGDVNGDGIYDLVIGAPTYSSGQSAEGMFAVYLGGSRYEIQSNSTFLSETLDNANARVQSDVQDTRLGVKVSIAGDVNGDGFADVLASAGGSLTSGTPAPSVRLFSGAPGTSPAISQVWSSSVIGDVSAVGATAGDVNGGGSHSRIRSCAPRAQGAIRRPSSAGWSAEWRVTWSSVTARRHNRRCSLARTLPASTPPSTRWLSRTASRRRSHCSTDASATLAGRSTPRANTVAVEVSRRRSWASASCWRFRTGVSTTSCRSWSERARSTRPCHSRTR